MKASKIGLFSRLFKLSLLLVLLISMCLAHPITVSAKELSPGEKKATVSSPRQSLIWTRDLAEALKTAKKYRKWIMIDVYTNWCGWCKRLDATTYQDPTVIGYLQKSCICVKVNAEDPNLGAWTKKNYNVRSYPTILILDPNGQLKGRIVGYLEPASFCNQLLTILHS